MKPYRFVQLISGFDSGKNHWVENDLMQKHNVLLITSRKAKVKERMSETGLSNCLNLNKLADDEIRRILLEDHIKYHNATCNNWQIEYYMKNVYKSGDPSTYLWQFFDHIIIDEIIIDEAHSLATDATFCDAPFYVLEFIKAAYTQGKSKIIMMTATPNIIKDIVPYLLLQQKRLPPLGSLFVILFYFFNCSFTICLDYLRTVAAHILRVFDSNARYLSTRSLRSSMRDLISSPMSVSATVIRS